MRSLNTAFRNTAFGSTVRVAVVASCFQFLLAHAPVALAQEPIAQPAPQASGRGRGPIPVDPRVRIREYLFTETNETIPYAVFVSSKVRRDVKAPLVFALHGLGGTHTSLLRGNALVPTLATKRSMGRASNGRPASDTSTEIPESVSISNTR